MCLIIEKYDEKSTIKGGLYLTYIITFIVVRLGRERKSLHELYEIV